MTGGGVWVTEGSWDGAELWAEELVQAGSCYDAVVQVGTTVEHGGETGRTIQTLGFTSSLGNCIHSL